MLKENLKDLFNNGAMRKGQPQPHRPGENSPRLCGRQAPDRVEKDCDSRDKEGGGHGDKLFWRLTDGLKNLCGIAHEGVRVIGQLESYAHRGRGDARRVSQLHPELG